VQPSAKMVSPQNSARWSRKGAMWPEVWPGMKKISGSASPKR